MRRRSPNVARECCAAPPPFAAVMPVGSRRASVRRFAALSRCARHARMRASGWKQPPAFEMRRRPRKKRSNARARRLRATPRARAQCAQRMRAMPSQCAPYYANTPTKTPDSFSPTIPCAARARKRKKKMIPERESGVIEVVEVDRTFEPRPERERAVRLTRPPVKSISRMRSIAKCREIHRD